MIDELDKRLINELQKNGRQTYAELGKTLGVSEGTVRQRLKNLVKRGIVEVVGVPNLAILGYSFISIVGIQVRMSKLDKVAKSLSQNVAVCELTWVTGRYDLIATVVTPTSKEFSDFMKNELSTIHNVVRTETFVSLGIIKGKVGLANSIALITNLRVASRKKTKLTPY